MWGVANAYRPRVRTPAVDHVTLEEVQRYVQSCGGYTTAPIPFHSCLLFYYYYYKNRNGKDKLSFPLNVIW